MKNTHNLIVVALLCGASVLEAGQTVRRMALPVAGAAAAAYVGYQYGQRNAPARQDLIHRQFQNRLGAKAVLKFIIQEDKVGVGSIEVVGAASKNLYTLTNHLSPAEITVTHQAYVLANRSLGIFMPPAVVRNAEEIDALMCPQIVKDALNQLLVELNAR